MGGRRATAGALAGLLRLAAPVFLLRAVGVGANGDGPRGCGRWTVVAYASLMSEEYYLTAGLLANLSLASHVVHRPLRALAEEKLGWPQGVPRSGEELARIERFMVKVAKKLASGDELLDCTIAVVRLRQSPKCRAATELARAYRKRGLRHAFVVLGEEGNGCLACRKFYDLAPFVVRHYHSEDCAAAAGPRGGGGDGRVLTLPMGLQQAPPPDLQPAAPASGRPLWWSFASQHTNDVRNAMAMLFSRRLGGVQSRFLLRYPGSDPDYQRTLCRSSFVLCPRGNHEDTWRLHEALFCGAIPVVTDGGAYFGRYMPADLVRHFITVAAGPPLNKTSLKDAGNAVASLVADAEALDRRQRLLRKAYEDYQEAWRRELAGRLAKVGGTERRAARSSTGAESVAGAEL